LTEGPPLSEGPRLARLSELSHRVDGPGWTGGIAGIAACLVAGARILVVGHGNVASFIVVGSAHVRGRIPTGVPIRSGQGYDGQFYYRMALGPLNFSRTALGIRMDTLSRFERISYPAVSWLVGAGQSQVIPWSLLLVNVIGLASLGALGAVMARDARRHSCWGLLLPGYFGFVWVLSRDLAEIVTATFVVAGVMAVRRNRYVLAAAAFSAAVLSRETALLVIALLALEGPVCSLRARLGARGAGPGPPLAPLSGGPRATPACAWLVPAAAFVGWQLAVRAATGSWPLLTSGQHNLDLPLVGLVRGLRHYLGRLPSTGALLWFAELAILAVVVVWAARALPTTTARLYERAAWVLYGIVDLSLAPGIWLGDVGFRSLDDLYVFSCIILLSSRRRLTVPAVLVAGSWVVVAVELVRFI